ncbi:D-alanyl-D-alanine carboxypeptidase [Brevibacillus sp. SYP-B805]|uniref:D-alanyl-D-alanine carboxypeptidase family protein n=1 Tax=Brevibacillus sp. SYP-B805 TaxID=1578199 RepID=UPI0013EBB233|nr:D-alanyl-D-alanine carboxypeptidase family protein [Brevibacillus sp. SYP-B805]NGQ94631.1 D-alanyl-D-alanine carboxypeptidase [Brevibacillus sp. SYP-B805]
MKYLRRLSGVLVVFLLFFTLPVSAVVAEGADEPPVISAEAAALIDVASGRILYEKNGDKKMRIASLTKTMTAIVAIEEGHLQDVVEIPQEAVGVEGSSIYLRKGEHLTLEELLYGLMLRSGNDAATAIAIHVGGSVPGFVHMMNEKAALIGMTHTQFMNPHGLDDSNMHYSTAVDMVKLSAYALKNPVFRQIVATKVKNIAWEGQSWERRLQNKNKLLQLFKGADGVKTGYTKLAKRCLASSATRDGRQLAAITLNAPDDWDDSMKLLDWGFHTFQPVKVVSKGETIDPDVPIASEDENLQLVTLNEFFYPLRNTETSQITSRVQLFQPRLEEAMAGTHVGFLQIFLGKQLIGRIPLSVREAAPTLKSEAMREGEDSFWSLLWRIAAGGVLHA